MTISKTAPCSSSVPNAQEPNESAHLTLFPDIRNGGTVVGFGSLAPGSGVPAVRQPQGAGTAQPGSATVPLRSVSPVFQHQNWYADAGIEPGVPNVGVGVVSVRRSRSVTQRSGKRKRGRPRKPMPDPIPDMPEGISWAIMQTPPKKEWDYLQATSACTSGEAGGARDQIRTEE